MTGVKGQLAGLGRGILWQPPAYSLFLQYGCHCPCQRWISTFRHLVQHLWTWLI